MEFIIREVEVLSKLSHINIIKPISSGTDTWFKENGYQANTSFIANELVFGAELFDFVHYRGTQPRFTESEARFIFYQALSGLEHIHQQGFVHRDIKLENIMLDVNGCVKIIDFGYAESSQ